MLLEIAGNATWGIRTVEKFVVDGEYKPKLIIFTKILIKITFYRYLLLWWNW